jgi:hypothetical protein
MFDDHWRFCCRSQDSAGKRPSRHHVSEDREIPENTRNLYFTRRLKNPEGGGERSHRVGSPIGGAGPSLAAPACGEATLAHYYHRPFTYIIIPENLSQGGSEIDTTASAGQKTPREKSSLAGRNLAGKFLPEEGRSSSSSSSSSSSC